MQSSIKRILTSILLSVIVISFMVCPVHAKQAIYLDLDESLYGSIECEAETDVYINIPRSTYYGFYIYHSDVDVVIYDQLYNSDGKKLELSQISGYGYHGSILSDISKHMSGYLEKGEYILHLSSNSWFQIAGFDGEVSVSVNGKKIDRTLTCSVYFGSPNYFYVNDGEEVTLSITSGKHSVNGTKIYSDSAVTVGNNTNISLKKGESVAFELDNEDGDPLLLFSICACGDPKCRFVGETHSNILIAEGKNVEYPFKSTNIFNVENSHSILMGFEPYDRLDTSKMSFDVPTVFYEDIRYSDPSSGYYSEGRVAVGYCFIRDKSSDNILELNKEYSISPISFAERSMGSQTVYAFTPEKDGTYYLTSTSEGANPYVAVFDNDDNCIGWYDNSINLSDVDYSEYCTSENLARIDYELDMKIDLKAGRTYYFYFSIGEELYSQNYDSYKYVHFENDKPYNIKLSYKDDQVLTSTPTPIPTSTTIQPSAQSGGTFADFVERLYVVALERASEPEGKAFWCEKVQDGTYDGAYCARFFLTSPEFLGKNKTDGELVDTLYRTFFDREADDEGRAFWVDKLKTSSRESIVEGFINSTEWCNICASYGVKSGAKWAKATIASANATAFATRLYTECLGRSPEEGGLNYWSLSLTNLERTGTQAAKEFFYSEEFLGKNLSNEDYVMRLYKTFMGREPEAEGKAYWLDLLNNGGSRDEVFNFFSSCPEFTEICTKYAIDR